MTTPLAAAASTLPLPPADAAVVRRSTTTRRHRGTSSPGAPARTTRARRGRRAGLLVGAALAAVVAAGCNGPVHEWVPDANADGVIDDAEIAARTQQIQQAAAQLDAQRRAVQAHPFLACVRAHESDRAGGYAAQNGSSSASGAYQFLDSTWRNVSVRAGFPGYARAVHAPWYVQDAVAMWLVNNGGRSAWSGTGC